MKNISYLIITPRVSSMGGAQLYVLRRVEYLKARGIQSKILVFDDQNFILKDKFDINSILKVDQIKDFPAIYSRKVLSLIMKKILSFIGEYDANLVIESHTPVLSIWGEIISDIYKCKHIIYFLSEPNIKSLSLKCYRNYFLAKLNNNELIGISNISLKIIFKDLFKKENNNYVNVPFDKNEIVDITTHQVISSIDDDSFIIATISRLGKAYVEPLIKKIISIDKSNIDKKIVFFVIGNDNDRSILDRLSSTYRIDDDKLHIIYTGYMYPIGRDFFKKIDLFIGMGTSVVNSISQGCATITINPLTSKASGIFGVSNFNFAYSENGLDYDIGEIILSLINDNSKLIEAKIKGEELFEKEYSIKNTMKKLDSFIYINRIEFDTRRFMSFKLKSYYNLLRFCQYLKNRVFQSILTFIGCKRYKGRVHFK